MASRRKGYDRLSDYGAKPAIQSEDGVALSRVPTSGHSRSSAVYFVDGPLEGQTFTRSHGMKYGDTVLIPYLRTASFGEAWRPPAAHLYVLKWPTGDGDWYAEYMHSI